MCSVPNLRRLGALITLVLSALLLSNLNDGFTKRLVKREPLIGESERPNSTATFLADGGLDTKVASINLSYHHPSHTINKRARTLKYDDAVCTGRALYQRILAAYEGTGTPGREFSEPDIENGWFRDNDKGGVDVFWVDAFKAIGKALNVGDRAPTTDEDFLVDLIQNKPFKNTDGAQVNVFQKAAHFEISYVPTFSAIVVNNMNSPRNQVKQRFKNNIAEADIEKRVPPLNRFSDVMWTVWSTISKSPNGLRFIGHDNISNDNTFGIMKEIFEKGEAKGPVNWPGLKFGIDTEEGMALLGTPNGIGTARLLIDRAGKLGRRIPEIYIFSPFPEMGGFYRMLWDLRPLSPTSTISPLPTSKSMSTSKPVTT